MSANQNQKVLSTMTGYELMATIEALEKQGLNVNSFKLIRQDKKLAEEIANIILSKQLQPGIDDQQFGSIMGKENYFGPTEWLRYFNVYLDMELPISLFRLAQIAEDDCPFEKNKKVKDTHFLFRLPRKIEIPTMDRYLTIQTWRKILSANRQPRFVGGNTKTRWFDVKDYAKNPHHRFDWFLMYKEVVHYDTGFLEIPPNNYLKPNVLEAVSMHFLYYIKNKLYLNQHEAGCTCDENNEETPHNFASVGLFDKIGISISGSTDANGIFLFRKLE